MHIFVEWYLLDISDPLVNESTIAFSIWVCENELKIVFLVKFY